MIKRIIGLLVAAAVIAILVFAVMNRGKYRSMVGEQPTRQTPVSAVKPTSETSASVHRAQSQEASAPDSLAGDRR